jgi:hypothetical protein
MRMSEINEILGLLEYIHQKKRPLSLVQTYQGVSSSFEVGIDQILRKRGDVVVAAQYGHKISLLPATQIQIHSDLFPKPIQARVGSVDLQHRKAVLQVLSYLQAKEDNRKELRIQPKHELKATVTIGGQNERTGIVNDISVEGISLILMTTNLDLSQVFLPNTSVRVILNLQIPNQSRSETISMPAKVTYINTIKPMEEFRVGFSTYPKEHHKDLLRRFIFDHQTEMFSELSRDIPL